MKRKEGEEGFGEDRWRCGGEKGLGGAGVGAV